MAIEGLETTDIQITASLDKISQLGDIFVNFKPEIVAVPNDWQRLWDLSERENLSLEDQEAKEKELLRILQVEFIQNSNFRLSIKFFGG